MALRLIRRVAILLIGLLAFAQASVSLAACPLERGSLARVVAATSEAPCSGCGTAVTEYGPHYANRCVAHCTADLQLAGLPLAIVRGAADSPVLVVAGPERHPAARTGLDAPPPGTPPRRILLHSFLV